MSSNQILFGLGLVLVLAVSAQLIARVLRVPGLVVLLPAGFIAGVATSTLKLYKVETALVATTDGSVNSTGANRLTVTVSPATADHFVLTGAGKAGAAEAGWSGGATGGVAGWSGGVAAAGVAAAAAARSSATMIASALAGSAGREARKLAYVPIITSLRRGAGGGVVGVPSGPVGAVDGAPGSGFWATGLAPPASRMTK